ncbi:MULTISPECIES: hypothetical protein [Burkholderia]|uniref:hypothetical protein n=3 Tax=Bacteria TaxID=2 RepID=UPI00158A2909|nr:MULTISPECIES: hypothetical protein [Burkholderia]QVN13019.1 hypothetical protein JYG37_07600 [Burkholderia sp. LAS2]
MPTGSALNAPPRSKTIDTWITRASGLATVGTLAFAVFGYFYTVLPVFQNQKLQEDNAKLQLDNEAAEKRNKALLQRQNELARKTEQMQAELEDQKTALYLASKNAASAKIREEGALRQAAEASSQMKTQYGELDKARLKLAITHLETVLLFTQIRAVDKFYSTVYRAGEDASFIKATKDVWPNPFRIISDAWVNASKDKSVPFEYFQRLRVAINEHADQLTCAIPDLDSLANQYDSERKTVLDGLEKRAKDEIERQRVDAKKEGKELLIDSNTIPQFERTYRIVDMHSLNSKYQKNLTDAQKPCLQKISDFMKKLPREFNIDSA